MQIYLVNLHLHRASLVFAKQISLLDTREHIDTPLRFMHRFHISVEHRDELGLRVSYPKVVLSILVFTVSSTLLCILKRTQNSLQFVPPDSLRQ